MTTVPEAYIHQTSLLGPCRDGIVILDTETTGLHPFHGDAPFIVGLANTDGRTALVNIASEPPDGFLDLLKDSTLAKVGHNIRFDAHMLKALNLGMSGAFRDTMILAQLVDPRMPSYRLKDLARTILGVTPRNEEQLLEWLAAERRRRRSAGMVKGQPYVEPNYSDVPRSILEPYLRDDLEYTAKLYFLLRPVALKRFPEIVEVEERLTRVLYEMEQRGVYVDTDYFKGMLRTAESAIHGIETQIKAAAGPTFNWRSGKHLGDLLFRKLKMKCVKHTEKGAPSLDAETLPLYDHPVARQVLEARTYEKLAKTYYRALSEKSVKGVIHPSFRQHGALTGRMSCADPNLQNIPNRDTSVRQGFVRRPGFNMVYMDYIQIEYKLFAHYCEDARLIEAATSEDLHEKTGIVLFGAVAKGNKHLRKVAKTINFAVLYGAGARSLRRQLRKRLMEEAHDELAGNKLLRDLANISETDARLLIRKYFKVYPGASKLMKRIQQDLYRDGRVVDAFGRDYSVPIREAYKATNYLVQGTAAGVMKRGLVRLASLLRARRRAGDACHLVNVVHDEFQIEVPLALWNASARRLALVKDMVGAVEDHETFRMPIIVSVDYSDTNWAEKKEVKGWTR